MAERIETPPTLQGDEKKQLQQVWSYLYQLAESINNNLQGIGSNELTDSERAVMQNIITEGEAQGLSETETLKSLIIKTADFVQSNLQEFRLNLLGETVASGQFGRYVRHTGLDVAVTPTGITQNYSFEEVVQGLKEYSINAKNYIKTGLLRTVSSIPVYGVAIGKDVVTFSQDGTETYNDGNKVAELTADELSFWQNSEKVASYKGTELVFYTGGSARLKINSNGVTILSGSTKLAELLSTALKFYYSGALRTQMDGDGVKIYDGTRLMMNIGQSKISFYINGSEKFYIESGKLYSYGSMELGSSQYMKIGKWTFSGYGLTCDMSLAGDPGPIMKISFTNNYGEIQFTDSSGNVGTMQIDTQTFIDSHGGLYTKSGHMDIPIITSVEISAADIYYYYLHQLSSREIKHNIQNLRDMGEELDRLRPVTFVYDSDAEERTRMGLIYEETINVMPEICTMIESGKAINYIDLIPVMLKEIQGLRARVKALEEREGGN